MLRTKCLHVCLHIDWNPYCTLKQVTSCSMHSIVTTFRGAVIKVEVANFCAAMDTLIDQMILSLYVHQSDLMTNASFHLLNHKCYVAFLNPIPIFIDNLQHVLCKTFLLGVIFLFFSDHIV